MAQLDVAKTPIEKLARPFVAFAEHRLGGTMLLLGATLFAILWANSPWAPLYESLLNTTVTVGAGDFALSKPFLLWVNDGLMGIFFFLVGLEIKREVLEGELSSLRRAALPIAAAFGGMVVPALVYSGFNHGGPGHTGWGIPMATDIAFALGVLGLIGPRVPAGLRIFLAALAIADDIGAVLVIAVFYTEHLSLVSLALGGVMLLVSIAANIAGVRNSAVYFLLGLVAWVAFLKSGVHATLAAVLMAFTIPARTRIDGERFAFTMEGLLAKLRETGLPGTTRFLSADQQHLLQSMNTSIDFASAPLQRLEHAIAPFSTFLVLPLFAIANAGVHIGPGFFASLTDPITLGVALGLFVGKQIGIFATSLIAVRLRLGDLPANVTWRQLHGVSVLGGIGFTMSLFVAGLAFQDPALQDEAKVGILLGSLLSAIVGVLLLKSAPAAAGTQATAPTSG